MKKILKLIKNPFIILIFITIIFFWQVFLKGYIPFPADLLLSEYNPWRHTSYFGYVEGSIPNKAQYFDVIRELYPWKTLVIDQLKAGHIPLWNPYNFSGAPLMANYQSQVWYPLSILYFFLPQPLAWTVLVILQILLGSVFMYLFAASIGLTPVASILAAILFNYSSFSNVWLEFNTVWHTILWIPLILYLIEQRIKRTLVWQEKLLFVFALFSSMTAGHPQDFINSFLFILVYIAARLFFLPPKAVKSKKAISMDIGILTALTFAIGSIQILPTIQLFLASARVPHDPLYVINSMLIQTWQLPVAFITDFFGNPATRTYVIPDTYVNKSLSIGTIGFMLVLISLWSKKTFHFKFFTVTSALLLVLATNNPFSQFFYRFPIPILSTGTPTRNLFIYIFCTSILAATGYDFLKENRSLKKPVFILIVIFAIIFIGYVVKPALFYSFGPITVQAMKKSFVLAGGLSALGWACVYISKKIPIFRTGLLVLSVFELFVGFTKFNAFVPAGYIFPQSEIFTYLQKNAGIERFWGYGTAQIEANFATQYRVYSPDGTDPLNLKWYNALVQSSDGGNLPKIFTRKTRSDASIRPGYGIDDLPDNAYRLRVFDALSVRFILDRAENPKDETTFDPKRFTLRTKIKDWSIYENLLVVPRYLLTDTAKFYSTDEEFERLFFDPSFDPRSMITLPEKYSTLEVKDGPTTGIVELLTYEPNYVKFQVTTDRPQFLFLSDTYDKGWKSFVDGKPVETLQANYAMRAVYVPEGSHTVYMRYLPDEFIQGTIVSLAGVVLLVIFILLGRTHRAI